MLKLLQTFVDIALWRKGPQDLPASTFLAWLAFAMYVVCSLVQVELALSRQSEVMLVIAIDVAMLLGWTWLVLGFFRRRERFAQTAAALLGAGALLGAFDIFMHMLQWSMGLGKPAALARAYILFFALALVMGRIFMHALERGLFTGVAFAFAIIYSSNAVTQLALLQLRSS